MSTLFFTYVRKHPVDLYQLVVVILVFVDLTKFIIKNLL